ncbi:hypothetical protein HKD37_14G040988 [Glycine soja]|uniref:PHD-type zinc finger plants domain-containing protein n=1 Tax=Glycine soja TaxID=3848 RepID=A0A0B2RQS5_GLYSO|nr:uncharacterized protein LOC114382986 [Glycine soja]KAG4954827.1 hypothetical protein JHK87_040421 [Glycine soja]KHN35460.1 hypothetical protein glysoja_032215 [Glycine soja]RZB69588.1 hypothetical protein D0Y65_039090 [Glycine soja]
MTTKGTTHSEPNNTECCMCGDLGFSDQLFQCKVCQFRSQHRYCSNLYPKPESLGTCNWCLSQREDTKEKSTNSSNSSSSIRNNDDERRYKRIRNGNNNSAQNIGPVKKEVKGSVLHLQIQKPIKKPKSPESSRSPSASNSPPKSSLVLVSTRKRIVTNGALEERLRRTRSENITRSGTTKQVFRNKVRRYKLLDEVSS